MVTIEQVKQLETSVSRAIDHLTKVTEENTLLKSKLDTYQKRVEELEILIQRFKDDQNRIEDGILSALDRLNQFEDSAEKSSTPEKKTRIISTTKIDEHVSVVDSDSEDIPLDVPTEAAEATETPLEPEIF